MSDVIPFTPRSAAKQIPGAWPFAGLFLFRLGFTYLVLTCCLWIFEFADKTTALIARPFFAIWRPATVWIAVHLYRWPSDIALIFVRDTRYLCALLTAFLAFSTLTAIVWSALDRKRDRYRELNGWLRTLLRYALAYLLLHYGMDKVFLLQFPAPSLARLTERFGDYSPSSLMWAFIGSSAAYTVFGGLAEILGGLLLLFRSTTTLGALIGFAVMFNVTVMDFSYDVGVKLLCLHILLMAVYLVAPDTGRLLRFFVLNRATEAAAEPRIAHKYRRWLLAIKVCLLLYLIVPLTLREWKSYRQVGAGAPRPPLYGIYSVEEWKRNGVDHPALVTDASRWRYVFFETPNTLEVRHMDDSLTSSRMVYDAASHMLREELPGPGSQNYQLHVAELGNGDLELSGSIAGDSIDTKLKRMDPNGFTLVSRGFHWISESSFIH